MSDGSGALPGLMPDLGLSKINWEVVFFLFLALLGGFTPAEPYLYPFPNPAGQN